MRQGWHLLGIVLLCAGLMGQAHGSDLSQRQAELKKLQQAINAKAQSLKSSQRQIDQLQALLAKDEKAIAKAAASLNQTENKLKAVNAEVAQTQTRITQLSELKKSQQQILAKQVASAYFSGTHDYTKMLLNQEDPSRVERMLVYYQYLNKARARSLEQLKKTSQQLDESQRQAREQQASLKQLKSKQLKQRDELQAEQSQRKATVAQLNKSISSEGQRLEQMQIEEGSLKQVIEQAIAASRNNTSLPGINVKRGKLAWPTRGRIVTNFGTKRSGQIRWNGVTISAPEGRSIRAVENGKVLYADWMKGYGMVMVIDHGKGYMSLYGHAQTLFKRAGDSVKKGDSIALVGRSGGSKQPGLYFEMRRKGSPVNPKNYCK